MLLRRHLEFKTHENDAFSGECGSADEAERRRIESPQDCRRLWSACGVKTASFLGEAARAENERPARRRSTKRLHAERRRIKTAQDCGRLRSACVGEAMSFWGEIARAGSEATACGRSAKRVNVETHIWPASDSKRIENRRTPEAVRTETEPNKAVEPMPTAVTNRACARFAPAAVMAHL